MGRPAIFFELKIVESLANLGAVLLVGSKYIYFLLHKMGMIFPDAGHRVPPNSLDRFSLRHPLSRTKTPPIYS